MRPIAILSVAGDIAQYKAIETGMILDRGINGSEWEKDGPRDEPYGKEDSRDHAQEVDEEVGVESVGFPYPIVVCFEYCQWPAIYLGAQACDSFPGELNTLSKSCNTGRWRGRRMRCANR